MSSRSNLKLLIKKEISSVLKEAQEEINLEDISSDSFISNESVPPVEVEDTPLKKISLKDKLKEWYLNHRVTSACCDDLLKILRDENLNVPLRSTSLVKKNKILIRTVSPGTYVHIGLKKQLFKLKDLIKEADSVVLDFNIDGIQLFKSSSLSLWPILTKIVYPSLPNVTVFPIGIYLGQKKPFSVNNYLHDFSYEMADLIRNGIHIDAKIINIKIRAFVCDAPARSFIRQTIGHNAFSGCHKCIQVGERIGNNNAFCTTRGISRTDEDFSKRIDQKIHKTHPDDRLSLEDIGIGMVTQFPLDPMHLLDLGVTKKMLTLLIKRKTIGFRLTDDMKQRISANLLSFSAYIPKEFARKPRSLDEICRWKATEFRQFILYTGIAVLKNVVSEDVFYHFCLFHCAYRLLASKGCRVAPSPK